MDHYQANGSSSGRFQWGSYGFAAGVVVGLLMGWMFHGFVGAFVRVGLAALVIIPIVLAFIVWRKVIAPWLAPDPPPARTYDGDYGAIETRAVVRGVVHEPRAR